MEHNDQLIQKLSSDVSYMRGKVDATFESIEKNSDKVSRMLEAHDIRIGSVEKQQGTIKTKVSLISSGIGIAVGFISHFLFKKF